MDSTTTGYRAGRHSAVPALSGSVGISPRRSRSLHRIVSIVLAATAGSVPVLLGMTGPIDSPVQPAPLLDSGSGVAAAAGEAAGGDGVATARDTAGAAAAAAAGDGPDHLDQERPGGQADRGARGDIHRAGGGR